MKKIKKKKKRVSVTCGDHTAGKSAGPALLAPHFLFFLTGSGAVSTCSVSGLLGVSGSGVLSTRSVSRLLDRVVRVSISHCRWRWDPVPTFQVKFAGLAG